MTEIEGVIKFDLQHRTMPLAEPDLSALLAWRTVLLRLGMVGADPHRYGGYGFGNLSYRHQSGFYITGSQTGHLLNLSVSHIALVEEFDVEQNLIVSSGEVPPSSESLSHAAVYQANESVGAVFHVHCPGLWRSPNLPRTPDSVAYGTPAMARAVSELIVDNAGVFAMGGHEDGVMAYGTDCRETGLLLIDNFVANS